MYKLSSGFPACLPIVCLSCEGIPILSTVFAENQVEVRPDNDTSDYVRPTAVRQTDATDEVVVELGVWLSGLESFLASGHHSFLDSTGLKTADAAKEFRLVHLTLQRCSMLNARLLAVAGSKAADEKVTPEITFNDLQRLSHALRESTMLSGGLIHSNSLGFGAWNAWSNTLSHRFRTLPQFAKIINFAQQTGKNYLPAPLNDLAISTGFLSAEHAELALILPRLGTILKWLSVVGRMLKDDEPLKPALLIFSRINDQIFDLTNYINNRLERFPDEETELFSTLDAASYTASIELKKVYSQELAGVAGMRPSPSIYARMETAHSLLNEGFQQILAGFARILDPETDIFELFPGFQIKLRESIILRRELYVIVELVKAAEAHPEKPQVEKMHTALRKFMKESVRFLFYKDTETVERFVEEILITKQNKDLVPILHRFGAYLETLFNQISLRAVLEKYPFDISELPK